jgi:hypothetical protein
LGKVAVTRIVYALISALFEVEIVNALAEYAMNEGKFDDTYFAE